MLFSIPNSVVTQNSQLAFRGNKGKDAKKAAELVDRDGFEISRSFMLKKLKESNPEAFKTAIRNDVEHKVLSMSNLEIIKTLFKSIFKIK